jgi:hypothetical protein
MKNESNTAVSSPAIDVNAVFSALDTWIKQRPGLEYANYGQMAPYRAELRSIAQDKQRAMKALDEARALLPAEPELLADAFKRAFSGRLEWVPALTEPSAYYTERSRGHLSYTTGQYWPTEYRKAAASVLETYIATWRQKYADEHPQEFTYRTIEDVKAANRQIGNHWFDRGTMRFFNTKIESGLIGGKYFITSERCDDNHPRLFTVRRAEPDATIDTVGEFQQYRTRDDAREAVRELVKGGK